MLADMCAIVIKMKKRINTSQNFADSVRVSGLDGVSKIGASVIVVIENLPTQEKQSVLNKTPKMRSIIKFDDAVLF
jgi:hypothetical protein